MEELQYKHHGTGTFKVTTDKLLQCINYDLQRTREINNTEMNRKKKKEKKTILNLGQK